MENNNNSNWENTLRNKEKHLIKNKKNLKKEILKENEESFNDPNIINELKQARQIINFIFTSNRDSFNDNINYEEDGNLIFENEENKLKRKKLRNHPLIQNQLNKFIELYNFDEKSGILLKDSYLEIHFIIAKILYKNKKDDILTKLVNEDWEYDVKKLHYMDKFNLMESLYELADIWVPDICEYQISLFLKILREKILFYKNYK